MSIENLSSKIKNIFYKEDVEETVDVELSEEEDKLSDELASTLNFDSAMTDEEILIEFPEFKNNADMLSLYKGRAMKKGGDSLKKKDEIPVSKDSSEDLVELESEVPSTSPENPLDDPNLTAGGDDEVQAQVSTEDTDVEEEVDNEAEDPKFTREYKIARKGDEEYKKYKGNRRTIGNEKGVYLQRLNERESWATASPKVFNQNTSKEDIIYDENTGIYSRGFGKKDVKLEKEETQTSDNSVQYSDAGNEDNELFFPDPTTPISMVDLQKAAIRNKLGNTPATEAEIDEIVRDFSKKHDVAKQKMITDISGEIDATGLKPTSKGFNKEVMTRVNNRTYADLNNYLLAENENIAVPKGALDTDILDIAPRILMNYYDNLSGDVLEDFNTYFTEELQDKQAEQFSKDKKTSIRQAMGPGITGDIRNQAQQMLEGFSTQSGIFEQTKADKSKNIMRGIYEVLSRPTYDDIPREWIDFIAQQTADGYHQSTPEFLEKQNANRMNVLEEYNLNRPTPLLLPKQAYDQALETIANLSGASEKDKNEIIKDKYGITFNEDGTANWSDEYLEELDKVIGETDRLTYEDYKNENKMEKNILAESIEGTLAGQIFTYMTDRPINPEYGVVYEDWEQFVIGVGNIALDLTLPLIGGITGKLSKVAMAKKQKDLMVTFSNIKKAQYDAIVAKTGTMSVAKKKALINKLDVEMAGHLKKYQGKVQIAGGAATLGVWEAAHTAVSDLHETNDITEVNLSMVIGSGIKGGILGGTISKIGMKALQVENQIKNLGFTPLSKYSRIAGVKGGALVGEAAVFGGGTAIYEGIKGDKTIGEIVKDATSPKTLGENLSFILGLRASKLPVKLFKGELFKAPKGSNTGIHTFKLTEAEKEYMGVKEKTDKEVYKEIEKTINGPNTERTLELVEALPLNVLNKYAFSSSGSQIRVDNPLDAVAAKWETKSETPGEVVIRNDKGIVLDVKNFGTPVAAEKYITGEIKNTNKNKSNLILTEEMLTPENKAKLNVELEKVGLTVEELKKLNLQEEINPKDRVTLESANEKVVEIYNEQRVEIEKVVKQFEADTEGMTSEQREEVLKSRIEDAKVEEKDIQQKKDAGIEEVSTEMQKLNEALGKKPSEPIEVTSENRTKLEEAAKTDLQKEAIKDIITATEALKKTDGKVFVHTDNLSYQRALDSVEKGNIGNLIGGHRVVSGKNKGDVHFNLNAINKRTPFHELPGHDLVENIRESNPEKIKRIEAEVYNLIKELPEFAPILDFVNQKAQGKEVYTEAEKRAEALAELIARSGKGEIKITQNSKFVDGLKNKLNTLMEKLGIDYRFATNSEALTFIAEVSKKLAKGETLDASELSKDFTEINKGNVEPSEIAPVVEITDMPALQKRANQRQGPINTTVPNASRVKFEDILKKYDGKFVVINSDPTKVGGKYNTQGGVKFSFMPENVKDGVGWSVSTPEKLNTLKNAILKTFPDGKGLALVMVQTPASLLGNNNAVKYMANGLSKINNKQIAEVFKDIKDRTLSKKSIISSSKRNPKTGKYEETKTISPENLQKLKDICDKYIDAKNTDVKHNFKDITDFMAGETFNFRTNFFKDVFSGINPKGETIRSKNAAPRILSEQGLSQRKYFEEIGEKSLIDNYFKAPDKTWGWGVSVIEVDANKVVSESAGVKHELFNNKIAGKAHLLERAYHVDDLVPTETSVSKSRQVSQSIYAKGDIKGELPKETRKLQLRVNQQADYHNKNEGSTFDQKGKVVTEGYSVSRYPERSRIIEGKEISAEQLEQYMKDNQDILSKNPNAVVGTWYNKEDGKTYLDISEVQKNLEKAKKVGIEANQIAIFDLKNFKEISTGGTGKALSEKQITRNNFNNKVKLIRQQYNDEISGLKQKTKEKDNAVKKVKSDLINYIKEAEHLNNGIKKSVLKNAVNVNTPEKLDRFISTVEDIAAKETLSSSLSEAKSLSKKIKKKLKKGLYTSQSKIIEELTNKDLTEIEDVITINEVNNVLKDLNRVKQPLVNPEQIKKISSEVDNLLKNVEAKEVKIADAEKINSNIEKLSNKIKETKLDASSTEGAKDALSIARGVEALKKSLYKAEQAEKVSPEESDKIKAEIQKIEKKTEGMLTEFNTERYNLSKDILKNSDLKSFSKHEKEQIETLKELQFLDNTGHNDNLFIAAINISNGFPPINTVGKLITEANNNNNGGKLSELIKNRTDKYAGKRAGLFTNLPNNIDKLVKKLAYTPLGLISERFRAERDVKDAGLIDKVIIAPLTRSMSRYEKDVKQTLNDWSTVGNSVGSKIVNWAKGESSSRLLSIPFTKGLNPLYHKKQMSDNKVGVILSQIERNSGDGKNVLKTILETPSLLANYSTAEKLYLNNIYKNLPKKNVDGKEVVDVDKAVQSLTAREQKMIKKFRDLMDNNLMPKQNFANGQRGLPFESVENYYPNILKPGAKKSVMSEKEAYQNWAENIFNNNNKVASDAGKERVSTDINAIEFNVNKVVMDRIKQVNRDFHFTQEINNVRELLKDAKNKLPKEYDMYFDALSGRMRDAVGLHLNMHASMVNSELLAPLMQSVYSASLLRPGRLIAELGTESIRVGVGAAERIQDLPNTFKSIFDKSATNIVKTRNAVDKIFTKELAEKESIDTALNTILEMTDSPFIHKYSRHDVEFGKDVGGQNGLLNRLSNWGLGAVDRGTLFMAYMPAFTKEFKSITGKEFSYTDIKKPEYQKKYKQAILDASAIGDRAASQWKNVSVKGQGRTAILTPFGGVKASSEFAPILTFMGSFGYLETAMYQKSVRDALSGESASTKALGAKNAASILTAGVAYGTAIGAEILITKYLMDKQIIQQSESDDKMNQYNQDAELLKLNDEFNEEMQKIFTVKGVQKQMVSNSAFLLTSKYSAASRALLMVAGGAYDEWSKSAASSKEMNSSQKIEAIKENDTWLREILEAEEGTTTAKALIRGGLYATPTVKPGKVAEQMLPHLDNMMNTMLQEFPKAFWDWYAEGNATQVTGARQTHEKYRDELQFANLAQQGLRMYFMMRGTAAPGDRLVERYYNEMMKRYDKPTISFQEGVQRKHDRFGKTDRFGKSNRFGKPE